MPDIVIHKANYYQKANCFVTGMYGVVFFGFFFSFAGDISSAILWSKPPIPVLLSLFSLTAYKVFLPALLWIDRVFISFFLNELMFIELLYSSLLYSEWARGFPTENSPLKLLRSLSGTLLMFVVLISTLNYFFFCNNLGPLPILLLLLSDTLELLDLWDNFEDDNLFLLELLSS